MKKILFQSGKLLQKCIYVIHSIVKDLFSLIGDALRNYVYKYWRLYDKKPVSEKNLKNKSLDDLNLLKESEYDYLYSNIPVILTILGVISSIDNLWRNGFLIALLVIVGVNISIAHQEKKENIKVYDKIISQKLKEKRENNKKYQKEILKYLKDIKENLKK